MQVLGKMVMALLVKYWIYICGGMFFFVSFEGTIVMYKIIYMMMFLSCVALYQVSQFVNIRYAAVTVSAALHIFFATFNYKYHVFPLNVSSNSASVNTHSKILNTFTRDSVRHKTYLL